MAFADKQRKATYQCFMDMKQRCQNHNHKYYSSYGGRGSYPAEPAPRTSAIHLFSGSSRLQLDQRSPCSSRSANAPRSCWPMKSSGLPWGSASKCGCTCRLLTGRACEFSCRCSSDRGRVAASRNRWTGRKR